MPYLAHPKDDLAKPTLDFLTTHALLKATAPDYIRETQIRLIVEPLCDRLLNHFQHRAVEMIQHHLEELLRSGHPGYGVGNLINLLCHLQASIACPMASAAMPMLVGDRPKPNFKRKK